MVLTSISARMCRSAIRVVVSDVIGAASGLNSLLRAAHELRCISRLLQGAAGVRWNLNQSCCGYERVDHGRDLLSGQTK